MENESSKKVPTVIQLNYESNIFGYIIKTIFGILQLLLYVTITLYPKSFLQQFY